MSFLRHVIFLTGRWCTSLVHMRMWVSILALCACIGFLSLTRERPEMLQVAYGRRGGLFAQVRVNNGHQDFILDVSRPWPNAQPLTFAKCGQSFRHSKSSRGHGPRVEDSSAYSFDAHVCVIAWGTGMLYALPDGIVPLNDADTGQMIRLVPTTKVSFIRF